MKKYNIFRNSYINEFKNMQKWQGLSMEYIGFIVVQCVNIQTNPFPAKTSNKGLLSRIECIQATIFQLKQVQFWQSYSIRCSSWSIWNKGNNIDTLYKGVEKTWGISLTFFYRHSLQFQWGRANKYYHSYIYLLESCAGHLISEKGTKYKCQNINIHPW